MAIDGRRRDRAEDVLFCFCQQDAVFATVHSWMLSALFKFNQIAFIQGSQRISRKRLTFDVGDTTVHKAMTNVFRGKGINSHKVRRKKANTNLTAKITKANSIPKLS